MNYRQSASKKNEKRIYCIKSALYFAGNTITKICR